MSIDPPLSTHHRPALEFKSSSFNVPALVLARHDIAEIQQQLHEKIAQAPELFKHSPLVIDLHEVNKHPLDIDLATLITTLRALQFIPIAVTGATAGQNALALDLGLAVQTTSSLAHPKSKVAVPALPVMDEPEMPALPEPLQPAINVAPVVENRVITRPVRSGQRIYVKGDLTVLAPVSSSAELMAEGNIHVYAPLRGRALAGVQGNTACRIFCSDLQAELISIAGVYKLNEELDTKLKHKLVQVYLHDQMLLIQAL